MLNLYHPYWESMPVLLNPAFHSASFEQQPFQSRHVLQKKNYVEYLLQRFFGAFCPIFINDKREGHQHHTDEEGIHLNETLFERSVASILNVAAHESGHFYLSHGPQSNPLNLEHINQLFEIEADIFAAIFLALNQVSLQPSFDHFSQISDSLKKGRVHLKARFRMDILENHYIYARDCMQDASIPELIEYVKVAAFHDFHYYSADPSNFGDNHQRFHRHLVL